MKKQCEAITSGIAHRFYLPEHYTPKDHPKDKGLVLCSTEKDQCPYNAQGRECYDADLGLVYICKINANVSPNAKLTNKKRQDDNYINSKGLQEQCIE